MREKSNENRTKGSKITDENLAFRNVVKGANHGNLEKVKSSWGSQIVRGLSGERKNKSQTTTQNKKLPLSSSILVNQKNPTAHLNPKVKRFPPKSDSPSSLNASTPVRPNVASRDLFNELDHLRVLLQESKERELKLQAELSEFKRNSKDFELERELECKKNEIDGLVKRVELLESEKASLSNEVLSLNTVLDRKEHGFSRGSREDLTSVEMEVVELKRLNKELQLQKRDLACRLSSMESQLATLATVSEAEHVKNIKAEAFSLRHTNEDLCKQVEGLQMSRLNEVEELAYLRWMNSCLRNELLNLSNTNADRISGTNGAESPQNSLGFSSGGSYDHSRHSCPKKLNIKKLKHCSISDEEDGQLDCLDHSSNRNWNTSHDSARRHSISGSQWCADDFLHNSRRQSDVFISSKETVNEVLPMNTHKFKRRSCEKDKLLDNFDEDNKFDSCLDAEKRALRIPNPPPRPSCTSLSIHKEQSPLQIPPPPPPPPPPKEVSKNITSMVKRAPQVVELYHSLMRRDSKKDSLNGGTCETSDVANVRSNMIGEIENKSSYLLAVKEDVETQGEFVNFLIQEVNNAAFQDIEDVVAFVKWLDDELCFLVDERAVLKHFEWPEKKADILREAAFAYRDLKNLEHEVAFYMDDPLLSCDASLKKLINLSQKMERIVYSVLATRDSLMQRCKGFQIPTGWMLDHGILSKVKLGSMNLAKVYMNRVAAELQSMGTSDKDSSTDYMLLQGVRFAFRIHQFAGGFDAETMHAFEGLQNISLVLNKKE